MTPSNAMSARVPAEKSTAGARTAEPPTAESLGHQLRAALPAMRLHSVSLYDEQANVLWLSEGALGPDEHSLVVEAITTLAGDSSRATCENGLEDGRIAIFLAVRAPKGALVGLAMLLADIKSVGDGVVDRLITPQMRTIMQRIAVLLRPISRTDSTSGVQVMELAAAEIAGRTGSTGIAPTLAPPPVLAAPPVVAPPPVVAAAAAAETPPPKPAAASAPPVLSPQQVDDVLEFELTDLAPPATSTRATVSEPVSTADDGAAPSPSIASDESLITTVPSAAAPPATATTTSTARTLAEPPSFNLDIQPYVKLRSGGRSRRYEVQTRLPSTTRHPTTLDSFALQRLAAWLGSNRTAWTSQPTSFTLNLSITTLEDDRFPQLVASALKSHGIAPDNIGFEIAEALCAQRRAQVERFVAACDKLGCFVVIDDFSLDSSVVSLLRSKALRLVKIDAKLTSAALRDKLSQAMVVAIAQAVKVLGIHCAAKQVESKSSLQWLTAIGCDFAQGPAISPAQTLESLGSAPPA